MFVVLGSEEVRVPALIEADAAVALCVKVIPVEARVLEVIAHPEVVPPI